MKLTKLTSTATVPVRAHSDDAGMDLCADHAAVVNAGQTVRIKTGIAIQLDTGTVGIVCSRSGLASKHSVFVLNAPGIIDPSYIGDVGVLLHNAGTAPFYVNPGDRIAQLVVQPVIYPFIDIVDSLEATARGDGGFGSTGTSSIETKEKAV